MLFRSAETKAFYARYCMDKSFMAAAMKSKPKDQEFLPLMEQRIDYVLKTGGNWKKPIGSFRMVIDKEKPSNLISFCADGVKKISATQFEVRKTNWRPDRDLNILILTKGE